MDREQRSSYSRNAGLNLYYNVAHCIKKAVVFVLMEVPPAAETFVIMKFS